jgi:hypothetical protein
MSLRRRIRLFCDRRKNDRIKDLITSATPYVPVGNDVQFEVAFGDNGVLLDAGTLASLASSTLDVKDKTSITTLRGAPIMTQTVGPAEINTGLTQEQWEAGGENDCHCKFIFTKEETNIAVTKVDTDYHLAIGVISSGVPSQAATFAETILTLHEDGTGAAGAPPVNDPLYYTMAQSDARYGRMMVPMLFFGELIENQIFGFFKAPLACRIIGAQITAQVPPEGDQSAVTIDLIDDANAELGKVSTLPDGITEQETIFTTPLQLAAGETVRAKTLTTGTTQPGGYLTMNLIVSL